MKVQSKLSEPKSYFFRALCERGIGYAGMPSHSFEVARLEGHVLDFLKELIGGKEYCLSHCFKIVLIQFSSIHLLKPSHGKNNQIAVYSGNRLIQTLSTAICEVKPRAGCAKYAQIWHLLSLVQCLLKGSCAISLREVTLPSLTN